MALKVQLSGHTTTLRLDVERLAYDTTARLVPDASYVRGRLVRIELDAIRFVEPFGLVFLYMYAEHLLQLGAEEVEIVIPRGDVGIYLQRMELTDRLAKNPRIRIRQRQPLFAMRRNDLRYRLVELQVAHVDKDDEGEALAERILDVMLQKHTKEMSASTEQLELTLVEMIGNVAVHSGREEVILAAQTYQNRVSIAIADVGIGIPARLRKSGIYTGGEDHVAIETALRPGVSTRVGGGGYGLTTLSAEVQKNGHRLTIRSGKGQISLDRYRRARSDRLRPLPGTIVEVVW